MTTKLKRLSLRPEPISEVFEDEHGNHYLIATCAFLMWSTIGIVMTPEEVAEFQARPEMIDDLARRVCRSSSSFEDRLVPADIEQLVKEYWESNKTSQGKDPGA
jgi:hypothetical protein